MHYVRRLVICALALWASCAAAQDVPATTYRTVTAPDGVPLNVAETGPATGPGILFIHGVGQSHLSWQRQLNSPLAATHHLVAFDLRGHGGSGKPWTKDSYSRACTWADDVAAVMAATGLDRPVMVLWSYGGTIGMHYVRCRGVDNLSGIVFAASRAGLYANPQTNPKIPAASAKLAAPDLRLNAEGASEFASFLTATPPPPEIADTVRVMNLMYPPYARAANDGKQTLPDGSPYKDNVDLIPRLTTLPLLFVLGENDAFSSSAAAMPAIRARFPTADIRLYPNSGHWLFFEAAERFNRDLAAFTVMATSIKK